MAEWIGRTLSKVEIQKRLGRGGMAEVYLGHHTTLGRPVAVKFLHSFLSEDEAQRTRFRAEAQAVAAMRHPHIVQVFDFDAVDDQPYIVMELVEGAALDAYLERQSALGRRVPAETAARLVANLASALDYAHARGVVHRDLKPANVMLRREAGALDLEAPLPLEAEPILMDFGVARLADSTSRTATGGITGTAAYLSPEQAKGEPVDGRADVYSLGIVLYEMLAGRTPFEGAGDTAISVILKHLSAPPPPLPEAGAPVQAVLARSLAKDREARYSRAGEMAAELLAAIFGGLPGAAATPGQLGGLLATLERMLEQSRGYERALPANNYPARAALKGLGDLARQALNEAQDVAASLQPAPATPHPFSPRELETLTLAAQGLTNKEIAYRLGLSERTVQFHLNSVFNKTGASSRTEAVSLALRQGWLGE